MIYENDKNSIPLLISNMGKNKTSVKFLLKYQKIILKILRKKV